MITQIICNKCKKVISEQDREITTDEYNKMFHKKHYCKECKNA